MRNFVRLIYAAIFFQPIAIFAAEVSCAPLLDVNVKTLNEKKPLRLCEAYQNKVVLVVNTASKCAYTGQYEGLEKLYAKYKQQGLVVLGFPSNDFGAQEPGTDAEIQSFCRLTYGVKFPMFSKSRVRKENADPLYKKLASAAGEYPAWNFHKYLLDKQGQFIASYASHIGPSDSQMRSTIENLLKQ